MGRGDNLTILYPPGCREVTEDLGVDEIIRRLKTLSHTLQSMGQDDGAYQEYIPLAMHLADDFFLSHPSRDVQLLIACCIADILRVYAPDAPYKDAAHIKTIFLYLIKQLGGLKDPKDPAFKRYFYLLENLAYVKSFNMCFDLEDSQEIFCKLFKLMFNIVNDEHSSKVKSFMLDVLCPLINESDVVSNELLDTILCNVLEPLKSQRKNAYQLAKDIVIKCADTLEPYIVAFFNHVLILGREEKTLSISQKVYDLIYELFHFSPSILLAVLPQLEFKLKSTDEEERYGSVSLLARMFSEKESTLAYNHRALWKAFLGRYEVVMAIVTTAKKDFRIVVENADLLNFVKERTLDKKFKIRKEAMCGLAMIYKKHMSDNSLDPASLHSVQWIKDKILHGYYMTSIDDRLLVERLLNMCLVPYNLPPSERMHKLFLLFATIDDNASKAFIELLKHQLAVRKNVSELVELHGKPQDVERDKEIAQRLNAISKSLPDPIKVHEYLRKLSQNMSTDNSLLELMEAVVSPSVSCKTSVDSVTQILKKLGQPVMTNLYYNTIKMLLERVSNVMVDKEALRVLVEMITAAIMIKKDCLKVLNIPSDIATEKGLRLLFVLSFVYPAHFMDHDLLDQFVCLLSYAPEHSCPLILSVLTHVGRHCPIGKAFPDLMNRLTPICQKYAESQSPKQAKHAVRCLFVNSIDAEEIFLKILEKIRDQLSFQSEHYLTSIVTLGHIALKMPQKFLVPIKNIVSRKIVKELLMRNQTPEHLRGAANSSTDEDSWIEEDCLSYETLVKMEGIKMMARWLLGLKSDVISAQKTFRMLNAFVLHHGDLLECGRLLKCEMAYLRLAAGSAMLKICEQKGVGDQFTPEQFYNLSSLMFDEVPNIRERFSNKLHKGLARGIPHKCLPLDFMGFYALGGLEKDKKLKSTLKQYMILDINKRREYIRSITMSGAGEKATSQLPHIMPDYMMVFAVTILAHQPFFSDPLNIAQLEEIRSCLWFVLEPLMTKNDSYCFGFYKALIEQMKNHKDAINPEDQLANHKLWATCDLAMGLIISKTTSFDMKEFPAEPRIPPMYFKKHENPDFVNVKSYLPVELQVPAPKGSTKVLSGVPKKGANPAKSSSQTEVNSDSATNGISGKKRPAESKESLENQPGPSLPSKKGRIDEPNKITRYLQKEVEDT